MSSGTTEDAPTPLPPQQQPTLTPQSQAQIPNGGGGQGPPVPTGPSVGKARLQCHACNRLLEYDAGAQYVQCFSCSTMNAVQPNTQVGGRVLSMLCAICHTTNLAPYGINYVRCGSCSTISQVSHAYRQDNRMMSQQGPAQPQSQQSHSGRTMQPQQMAEPMDQSEMQGRGDDNFTGEVSASSGSGGFVDPTSLGAAT